MEQRIITAEAARKLTDKKSGGVPPEVIDKALYEIDYTIKIAASYKSMTEFTFYVSRLFFTDTGVVFSEEDRYNAARKVAWILRVEGYKVFFAHIGSFELNPEYSDYREEMTVSWRK